MSAKNAKIFWQPHSGPQTEVLSRIEFEVLYGGARGGGKTDAGIAWLTRWVHHPRLRALVIRKNADDLKDWKDRAQVMYRTCRGEVVGFPGEVRFPSGAKILLGHLKDDSAYTKYQGHEYQKMVIEEMNQIPSEENYLKLLASCRSTITELKPQVFGTTNPGGVGHQWVKQRFNISGKPSKSIFTKDPVSGRGRVFIPARVEDNPTLMKSDPSYIAFLDSLTPVLRKAWREGDWDIFAGQYFSEWDQNVHVVEPFEIPPTWRKFRAIDHGRTAPTAAMWGAVDHDGTLWWYREHYRAGQDADINAQTIAKLSEGETYWFTVLDSACFAKTGVGETIADIYRVNGVTCEPWPKNRIAGWNLFHEYLRNADQPPKMRFFKTCYNAIRTIPTLIHDERDPEDLDSSGEDHSADAIRGALEFLNEQKSPKPKDPIEQKLRQVRMQTRPNPLKLNRFYAKR